MTTIINVSGYEYTMTISPIYNDFEAFILKCNTEQQTSNFAKNTLIIDKQLQISQQLIVTIATYACRIV